jgi:hypothetical protein
VGLLLQGGWTTILLTSLTALGGVMAFAAGMTRPGARWPVRGALILGGLCLLHPSPWADLAGLAAVLISSRPLESHSP